MHSDVSLKYWGLENEFEGPNTVLQPGYQTIVDWCAKRIEQFGGKIVMEEKVRGIRATDGKLCRVARSSM